MKKNIIKNLKYEIKLDEKSKYIITSDFGEINEINGEEIVTMKKAVEFLTKNIPLKFQI